MKKMNSQQCGFYQTSSTNRGQSYRQQQQTYGGGAGSNNPNCCRGQPSYRPGTISAGRFNSQIRLAQQTRSSYGMNSRQVPARVPPVFSSSSSGSFQPQQQQRCWNGNGANRGPGARSAPSMQISISGQRGGGNACCTTDSCKMPHRQMEYQCQPNINQHPLAPAPYCTPQAIKVNVTADQLENAKNIPIYPDRGEASQADNPNAKYIQLNWQDLLGGMENLRVSMVPSPDPNCQNRQLKVSFGGQKTDPPAAGETSLKVVSIEPVNAGRMDIQMGNALAGHMKICNAPSGGPAEASRMPSMANCGPQQQCYSQQQQNYSQQQQNYSSRSGYSSQQSTRGTVSATCRR